MLKVNEMLYSLVNGLRVKATPSTHGICPHCEQETISKCGSIKIWHWAHKTACPYETEPETEWHLAFKELADNHGCALEQNMGKHIADAVNWNTQTVFEFQHSSISSEDIISRCEYAKDAALKINWIFDFRDRVNEFKFVKASEDETDYNMRFKKHRFKKSIRTSLFSNSMFCPKYGDVYFDLGVVDFQVQSLKKYYTLKFTNHVFKIVHLSERTWNYNWGKFVSKEDLFSS